MSCLSILCCKPSHNSDQPPSSVAWHLRLKTDCTNAVHRNCFALEKPSCACTITIREHPCFPRPCFVIAKHQQSQVLLCFIVMCVLCFHLLPSQMGLQLDKATNGNFSSVHILASSAICGVIQSLAGAQPLIIVSSSEPLVLLWKFVR